MKKKHLSQALEKYDTEKGYGRHIFGDTADIEKLRAIHKNLAQVSEEDELNPSISQKIKDIYKKMEQVAKTTATHRAITTLRNQIPLSELKSKLEEQQSVVAQVAKRAEYDKNHQSEINLEALEKKEKGGLQSLTNPNEINLKFASNLSYINFPHGIPTSSLINTSFDRLLYLEESRKELLSIQDKIHRLKSKGVPDKDIEKFIPKKEIKKTWEDLLEQYKICTEDLLHMIAHTIATNTDAFHNKIIGQKLSFSEEFFSDLPKIYHLIAQLKENDVPEKNKRDLQEIKATLKAMIEQLNTYEKVELKRAR